MQHRERPKPASYGAMFDSKVSSVPSQGAGGQQHVSQGPQDRHRERPMVGNANVHAHSGEGGGMVNSSKNSKSSNSDSNAKGDKVKRSANSVKSNKDNDESASSNKPSKQSSQGSSPGKLIKYMNLDDIPDEFPESYNDRSSNYNKSSNSSNNSNNNRGNKHTSFAADDNYDDDYEDDADLAPVAKGKLPLARKGTPVVQYKVKNDDYDDDNWGDDDNNNNDNDNNNNNYSNNNKYNSKYGGGYSDDQANEYDDGYNGGGGYEDDNVDVDDDYGAGFKAAPQMQKLQQFGGGKPKLGVQHSNNIMQYQGGSGVGGGGKKSASAGSANNYQSESAPNSRHSKFSDNSYNDYSPSEPDISSSKANNYGGRDVSGAAKKNVGMANINSGQQYYGGDDDDNDDDLDDWSDIYNNNNSNGVASKSKYGGGGALPNKSPSANSNNISKGGGGGANKKASFEPPPLPSQLHSKVTSFNDINSSSNNNNSYQINSSKPSNMSPRNNANRFPSPIVVSPTKGKQQVQVAPGGAVGVRYEKAVESSNFNKPSQGINNYNLSNNNSSNSNSNSNISSKQNMSNNHNFPTSTNVGHHPPLYNGHHIPPINAGPPPLPSELSTASSQAETDLAFSRAPRKVEYKPYTLDQYRVIRSKEYTEITNIKPDLNTDELIAKRSNAARVKDFANNLKKFNEKNLQQAPKKAPAGEEQEVIKSQLAMDSKRLKALEFAKNIPLPKNRSPTHERERRINDGMDEAMYDKYDGVQDTFAYKNLVDANPSVESRLAELEARHRDNQKRVEAISKKKHN